MAVQAREGVGLAATAASDAVHALPPGRYAVAVSGGPDSMALLTLARQCPHLQLEVLHVNHRLRGEESDADERFVFDRAAECGLPCVVVRREERGGGDEANTGNVQAAMRLVRRRAYEEAMHRGARAILLAHHADDQAETVLLRLLRGSAFTAITGMNREQQIGHVTLIRPLLQVRRGNLHRVLETNGIPSRQDSSNLSDKYARNRLRAILADNDVLVAALLSIHRSADALKHWLADITPLLDEAFACNQLADLPTPLARQAARTWLLSRGASPLALSDDAVDRLLAMTRDAATPPAQHYPGGLRVRRRRGMISVD